MIASHPAFTKTSYVVKRKLLGFGTSRFLDPATGSLVLYAKSRYMKWHGFKIFADEAEQNELIFARREMGGQTAAGIGKNMGALSKAFNALYIVKDVKMGTDIGGFQRQAFKSIFQDEWNILDVSGNSIGRIIEKGGFSAFLSRISPLFPQTYTFEISGRTVATLTGKFSMLAPWYELAIQDQTTDMRMIITGAALIAGVEGNQNNQ